MPPSGWIYSPPFDSFSTSAPPSGQNLSNRLDLWPTLNSALTCPKCSAREKVARELNLSFHRLPREFQQQKLLSDLLIRQKRWQTWQEKQSLIECRAISVPISSSYPTQWAVYPHFHISTHITQTHIQPPLNILGKLVTDVEHLGFFSVIAIQFSLKHFSAFVGIDGPNGLKWKIIYRHCFNIYWAEPWGREWNCLLSRFKTNVSIDGVIQCTGNNRNAALKSA